MCLDIHTVYALRFDGLADSLQLQVNHAGPVPLAAVRKNDVLRAQGDVVIRVARCLTEETNLRSASGRRDQRGLQICVAISSRASIVETLALHPMTH